MFDRQLKDCDHCGQSDVGTDEAGWSIVPSPEGYKYLCFPQEGSARLNCLSLVKLEDHPMPCEFCRSQAIPQAPPENDI
jgi:hypothetical protein